MRGARKSEFVVVDDPPSFSLVRSFDAPRSLVFDVWTQPEHLRRWWGGASEDTRLAVCEVDLRPGGAWRFVERTPDGEEHPFTGVYHEVVRPSRLVSTMVYDKPGWREKGSTDTVLFEEIDGTTRLSSTSVFRSREDRDTWATSGAEEGSARMFNRLIAYLAELTRPNAGAQTP